MKEKIKQLYEIHVYLRNLKQSFRMLFDKYRLLLKDQFLRLKQFLEL